jgi:hypothetical protein
VVSEWYERLPDEVGTVPVRSDTTVAFYANDGFLASYDVQKLQGSLDGIAELFACVELKINAGKTKVLMSVGGKIYWNLLTETYTRMKTTSEGLTHRDRMADQV